MRPTSEPSGEDELERLRAQKLHRYKRLQELREAGAEWPQAPVDAPTEVAMAFLRKYPVALLEFWAAWCRPCIKMQPVIEELATEFWGDVAFARLNLDDNPDAREVWGVTVLPTLIITKHAQEVTRLQGALTRSRLQRELRPFATSPEERLRREGHTKPPGERGESEAGPGGPFG